ncbi:hypothetical protein BDW72DRAFT_190869 [Aspergillus terricola var. indicus]
MIATAHTRRRRLLTLALVSLLSILYLCPSFLTLTSSPWIPLQTDLTAPVKARRITKASMLYGPRNVIYERALQTHRRHAQKWGYGMEVLQNEIATGYWNKPSYLLALVIRELSRPVNERVEWLMWVDADSMIINSLIPLELFLPPSVLDEIHMVASKDHKGLNTGIFFLRVHEWSVRFLIETLAYPIYNPGVDLGLQVDQSAMEKVLNQSSYREGVTYLPRTWINTYEWAHAYEGKRGNMLVHFPGLEEKRWEHMEAWLDLVERGVGGWDVPAQETWYLEEGGRFWKRVQEARYIIGEYERMKELKEKPGSDQRGREEESETNRLVGELRSVLYEEPFEGEALQQRIEKLRRLSDSA